MCLRDDTDEHISSLLVAFYPKSDIIFELKTYIPKNLSKTYIYKGGFIYLSFDKFYRQENVSF